MRLEEQERRSGEISGTQNSKESAPERERMSDEELGNLLAAIGNHEAKAILLSAMKEGIVYSSGDLRRLLNNIQYPYRGWKIINRLPFDYCQKSLSPIGLVTREVIDPSLNTYGYIKTEYGNTIGNSLAGHLLSLSERYEDKSLIQIFGPTHSSTASRDIKTKGGLSEYKKRSPIIRFKLLSSIASADFPLSISTLANRIGERDQNSLSNQLHDLSLHDIISYKNRDADEPYVFYSFLSDKPKNDSLQYKDEPLLTKMVVNIFHENPSVLLSAEDVVNFILQKYPEKKEIDRKNFVDHISKILSYLARQSYLERDKFSKVTQSQLFLNLEQSKLVTELVETIENFQSLDPKFINDGRRKMQEIINESRQVSNLLRKAKETSPNTRSTPIEQTAKRVLSLLSSHPKSSISDLQILLREHYEKELSSEGLRQSLVLLKKEGLIKVVDKKTAYYWSVVEKGSEETVSSASISEQNISPEEI